MTDLNRLRALSGRNPHQVLIDRLKMERKNLDESYGQVISRLERNQLDESTFTALKQSLSNASGSASSTSGPLPNSVKTLYQDPKSQTELGEVIKEISGIAGDFADLEEAAPNILKNDVELAKTLSLYKDLLAKTIAMLQARKAVAPVTEDVVAEGYDTSENNRLKFDDFEEWKAAATQEGAQVLNRDHDSAGAKGTKWFAMGHEGECGGFDTATKEGWLVEKWTKR